MTVAFDAFSSPSAEGQDPSWTHTPVGTPRGVVVFVLANDSTTDTITSVTYGGQALTRVDDVFGSNAQVNASGYIYFLGEGIPTGAQTVTVDTSGLSTAHAGCFTVTAAENVLCTLATGVHDFGGYTSGELATGPLALGANDNFLAAAAIILGRDASQVDANTGWTIRDEENVTLGGSSGGSSVFEYANRSSLATGNFTTPGPFTFGGTQSCIMLAAALREAAQVTLAVDVELIWNTEVTLPEPDTTRTELQAAALEAILSPGTQIVHQVDIYESDATTLWRRDAAYVDYRVDVDASRTIRRTCDLTLYNDADLAPRPGGLWYDKIIKVQRGVRITTGTTQVDDPLTILLVDTNTISLVDTNTIALEGGTTSEPVTSDYLEPVGVFRIDRIDTDGFPRPVITIAGSDQMAALDRAKFGVPTRFSPGQTVEAVAASIATLGGHTKLRLQATGLTLEREFTFEPDTTCAHALAQLAGAFGCEVYLDRFGYLVFRPQDDPATSPPIYTYQTGTDGNVAALHWTATGQRLYNDVVVSGEASDPDVPPVYARAENTNPASPTRIFDPDNPEAGGLPRTTYRYVSPFLTSEEQCEQTALTFLRRVALEDVEASAEVLAVPWLEENRVIRIVDDDPPPGEPAAQRFLLTSFSFTGAPGAHTVRAKRVVPVG